ncbi:hypothetical protein F4777DRAFT_575266 [Nemania sp. FL0916]|nr:hypothetical protein F4777DRAFT_575266 [Nemania sp. FL0916]
MECPSAGDGDAPRCRPGAGVPSTPDSGRADLLPHRPDPLNPLDLSGSDRTCPHSGPTSPIQLAAEGDENLMPSDGSHEEKDDDDGVLVQDEGGTLRWLNKGKAPGPAPHQLGYEGAASANSRIVAASEVQQAQNPSEPVLESRRPDSSAALIQTTTNEDESETLSPISQSGSEGGSYPPSLFEEASNDDLAAATTAITNGGASSKDKQKEKETAYLEAETQPTSDAPEEKPFHPLEPGDPGWETSPGRPPQKLPIRFRDAVGRNFLFPWEKAKTWTGMKGLVQKCFLHVDVLGPHVNAGHYDLSINLPYSMDAAKEVLSPGTAATTPTTQAPAPIAGTSSLSATGSSVPGPSSSTNTSQQQQQQQQKSSFVVLPELWEDTIEPGMLVVQHMWPFSGPYSQHQPFQPPPPTSPPPNHNFPPGWGRGARGGRGRGTGPGIFGGRGAHGIFGPPPPPPGSRPPIVIVDARSSRMTRGKTRKRQDRR